MLTCPGCGLASPSDGVGYEFRWMPPSSDPTPQGVSSEELAADRERRRRARDARNDKSPPTAGAVRGLGLAQVVFV